MEKKRDLLVDSLKGYACFLVVLGHVIMGIRKAGSFSSDYEVLVENFIWTFHVALFMFLSGYVYHITGECNGKGSKLGFIKHKLLNLGVPYLVFSIFYILINSMTPGVNNKKDISSILYLWKTPIAQYWFLYALIILFILWTILSGSLKNWQITIMLYIMLVISPFLDIEFGSFASAMGMALVFGIGTSIDKLYIDKFNILIKVLIIVLHISIVGIIVYFDLTNMVFIKQFAQILGIAASIAFISIIIKFEIINKCLLFINKYSFPIYLLHTIFTSAIRILFKKIHLTNYPIQVICSLLVGIFIPVIGAYIIGKIPVLDFFFYPTKNIKKMKRKER
ncbi:MAG: acyltransferase [Lachnospiraceae bacterium]|nr:acyltransferase [Lachnospiraceae bacterium]MBQ5851305.1 acyltransferase [Lachnospiraceae bacterium]MEE0920857.1 acyltransferase [Lachnospiraceae bacterium]